MRSTIDTWIRSGLAALLLMMMTACLHPPEKGPEPGSDMGGFKPYTIADSMKIVTYPNGLRLYIVRQGPGDFPVDGSQVRMDYYGTLEDSTIFDESYSRKQPLAFNVGSGKVIAGIDDAVRKLRYGSKAIVIIPPSLGYGGKDLPPNIPPNATLTFHLDLLGKF